MGTVSPLGSGNDDVFTVDTDNLHELTRHEIKRAVASKQRAAGGVREYRIAACSRALCGGARRARLPRSLEHALQFCIHCCTTRT
jgi:hypothetical protein